MSIFGQTYNVIVIGAGIAGVHAAKAAAYTQKTLLLTCSWDTAAWAAWGPIVRQGSIVSQKECSTIFARRHLAGSVMAEAVVNNELIANIDIARYQRRWKQALERSKRITIYQDTCESIARTEKAWEARTRWGARFSADRIIIAMGTFLGGAVRLGEQETVAGRPGEIGAEGFAFSGVGQNIDFRSVTASAPPGVRADTIDWSRLRPLADGRTGVPLYAAELDDGRLVVPAPIDRDNQQIYPYLCGPGRLSEEDLRRAPGFADMQTIAPGYQVTYRCLAPGQLTAAGEHRRAPGLFFAGRIAGAAEYAESIRSGCAAGRADR
jgi:tRNA U34 5-carboxymethylaminomethyl modifying enzyme MnmG/GidA